MQKNTYLTPWSWLAAGCTTLSLSCYIEDKKKPEELIFYTDSPYNCICGPIDLEQIKSSPNQMNVYYYERKTICQYLPDKNASTCGTELYSSQWICSGLEGKSWEYLDHYPKTAMHKFATVPTTVPTAASKSSTAGKLVYSIQFLKRCVWLEI